jgi:hypothetical protein
MKAWEARMRRNRSWSVEFVGLGLYAALGCGGMGRSSLEGGASGADTNASGNNTDTGGGRVLRGAGGASTGPTGNGGTFNPFGGAVGFSGTQGLGGVAGSSGGFGPACAAAIETPEAVVMERTLPPTYRPVAMYFMLDRSGSMVTGFPSGDPQSYANAGAGLVAFTNDPETTTRSIDMGLGFFPPTTSSGACDGSDCATPAIDIAPAATLEGTIAPLLSSAVPTGASTSPIECALRGMIQRCSSFSAASATGEPCVGVLITDGNPTQCDTSTQSLAQILADGEAQGVSTFVLGLAGADPALLNALATAGGTISAIDASGGTPNVIAALASVRARVSLGITTGVIETVTLPCEWRIPPPPAGTQFDPNRVNFRFTPKGGSPESLPYVASPSACTSGGGWYYDDPTNPTTIFVCPSTCDTIKATPDGSAEVLLGCGNPTAFR